MVGINYTHANQDYIGRINLVDIRADLHTFGKNYPSSGSDAGFLRERIQNNEIFIALENEELAAFIIFEIKNDEKLCYIHQVSVAPEFQRQGIAKELLNKVIDESKKEGCKIVCLTTTSNAPWSVNLYKKTGFIEVGTKDVRAEIKPYLNEWLGYKPETKTYFELNIQG